MHISKIYPLSILTRFFAAMHKQSSSIKSTFVGLTYGQTIDGCNDSIKSYFVGLTDGEITSNCDKSSSFNDEFDVFSFFGGLSKII